MIPILKSNFCRWRFLGFLLTCSLVAGCSTTPVQHGEPIEPVFPEHRILKADVGTPLQVYDPWEGFNRTMYRFNSGFDHYVFLPVVGTYQFVIPEAGQKGVHNFFNNFLDFRTFVNLVLQLKPEPAIETLWRIGMNSTIGLFGIIDIATPMGLNRHGEDFGQTLGYYGVGPGPYLVLPIVGPSNVRDGVGFVTDTIIDGLIDPLKLDSHPQWRLLYSTLRAIDLRANVAFRYYETGSPFEYELVRLLYNTKRQIEIAK